MMPWLTLITPTLRPLPITHLPRPAFSYPILIRPFYPDDASVAADADVQKWAEMLVAPDGALINNQLMTQEIELNYYSN